MNQHRQHDRGSGGRRHGGGRSGGDQDLQIRMPKPNPVHYYAEGSEAAEKPALRVGIIEEAEGLAEKLARVPASQLRRFYGDVTAFERRLDMDRSLTADAIRAQVALLKARAAYAYKRTSRREEFPDALLQFFVDHADAVRKREDYKAFRRVFETVIAFHKFYEVKKQGG